MTNLGINMVDLMASLFVGFGALAFIALKIFSGMFLTKVSEGHGFIVGTLLKYAVPGIMATIILVAGYFATGKCPAAGTVFAVGAVIVGGLPGMLVALLISKIPWTQTFMSAAIAPIMPYLWTLLIIYIIETVIGILSIFIPFLIPISMVLNIAVPIITMIILWGMFSKAFGEIPGCTGLGTQPKEIPLTGGAKVGTYT